jgi:hypothetical protein
MHNSISTLLAWLARACLIVSLTAILPAISVADDDGPSAFPLAPDTPCAGYAGLAIGVPYEDVSDAANAGAVNILHGGRSGLSADRSQDWHQESPGVPGVSEKDDRFGSRLAAGDFDGDDFTDLAVGSPWEAIGDTDDAGSVRILRGSLSGLTANDEDWTQDTPGVPDSSENGDAFGHALAGGDFNGDNYDDLAIGAMGEGFGSAQRAGAVTVLFGSVSGLTASGSQQWHQDSPGVPGGSEIGDMFGYSLAAGDFNGDGYADLAIGSPGEAIGDIPAAGSVRILYGSGSGLTATGANDFHQDIAGIPDESEPDDEFGVALAAGDFDNDSYDDLAVGAPGEGLLGISPHAGAVTIVYGAAGGLSANGSQQWHQESPGIIGGSEPDDNFGEAVAAGDFNRDGYVDLAVGVPGEAIGPRLAAGSVRILRGSASGLTANDENWSQESPGVVDESEAGDRFGLTLASGDFDDDAFADLAIGVPYEDLSTTEDAGAVRILRGSAGGLIGRNEDWNQGTFGVPDDPERGDLFGLSLASGYWCGIWHRVYLPMVVLQ